MTVSQSPFVSILTPVYNGGDYLADCIESVLKQTYQNYEYIIVNNCSTDRTLEVARHYAGLDRRIRVHDNEKFLGVIDNHNLAFSLMSKESKYCKVVSGDDYIFPTCVERMVELAEANPSVTIVGCFQLSGNVVKWQGFRYPASVISGREVGRRCLLENQFFSEGQPLMGFGTPTSLLYRADVVRQNAKFYPNPSPHSDTSACFNVLRDSDFGFVFEILSYERTHTETQTYASQQTNRYFSQTLNDLLEYGKFYLEEDELKLTIRETLKEYHRFLAVNYLLGSRGKDFWDYHTTRLKELGFPLGRVTLVKAALLTLLQESVNPGLAIQKFRKYSKIPYEKKRAPKSKPKSPMKSVPNEVVKTGA